MKCRECGCTEDNACHMGCFWIEEDLCSSCGTIAEEINYQFQNR